MPTAIRIIHHQHPCDATGRWWPEPMARSTFGFAAWRSCGFVRISPCCDAPAHDVVRDGRSSFLQFPSQQVGVMTAFIPALAKVNWGQFQQFSVASNRAFSTARLLRKASYVGHQNV